MKKKTVVASAISLACVTTAAFAQQPGESTPPAAEAGPPSWPVSGIWMPADAKDLGKLTGQEWLTGVKVRGWVDGYYVINRNHPSRSTVDGNQGASIVKGKNISVEGRTFDVQDQNPSLSLAEIEIEKIPERGGFGFKLDVAAGETQNVILDTIRGALGPMASKWQVNGLGRNIQHASVSYLAPIGTGLRLDLGKFVTHIGGETIATVKNWNYSHSFFYTYAIPFQDTGVRANYAWSDTLYTELYVLNGWNVTGDNNSGKTWGPSVGWTPLPWLSIVANYLTGPEQNNNSSNQRHLFDTQIMFGPFNDRWTFMVNYDHGTEERVPPANTTDVRWNGTTLYARYKINDTFEPSLRIEDFRDPNGFTTGTAQKLRGYTLTLNTKIPVGKTVIMVRPEIRYDRSDANFFTKGDAFQSTRNQTTIGVGLSAMF
ncbi:MAG: outer membrane beta-barrel protein [Betaproteobacteria bacterium]|nr:outer membrane beta-barrel protein [Betaproteobacteria bacterium]